MKLPFDWFAFWLSLSFLFVSPCQWVFPGLRWPCLGPRAGSRKLERPSFGKKVKQLVEVAAVPFPHWFPPHLLFCIPLSSVQWLIVCWSVTDDYTTATRVKMITTVAIALGKMNPPSFYCPHWLSVIIAIRLHNSISCQNAPGAVEILASPKIALNWIEFIKS